MYQDVIRSLCESYDRNATERDHYGIAAWKVEERQHFLEHLQNENMQSLLEIGAGPGRDSKFFQDNGLTVTCTDLSPEMVKLCQNKGLNAHVMDFLGLDFHQSSFDSVYALNCLLHVPKRDLSRVLELVQKVLKPSGLFFMGVYGNEDFEGIWPQDNYIPKRFFSFHTDEDIQKAVMPYFEIIYFKTIPVENNQHHFQSMILRRK